MSHEQNDRVIEALKEQIDELSHKTCSCGLSHEVGTLMTEGKYAFDALPSGWYWNCPCGSTLVLPLSRTTEIGALKRELESLTWKRDNPDYKSPMQKMKEAAHSDAEDIYDIHRDGIFTIVCDAKTGRRGSVISIYETQFECLDFDVCWFDTKQVESFPGMSFRIWKVREDRL